MTELPPGRPSGRHRTVSDLTEIIHELVSPSRHRQPYRAGWQRPNRTGPVIRDHVTDHESLIAQLRAAIVDRADTQAGAKAGQVPTTTLPRFSVDAFDRMERIRHEVAEWCNTLGVPSRSAESGRLIITYLEVIERAVDNSRLGNPETTRAIAVLRAVGSLISTAVEPDLVRFIELAPGFDQERLDGIGDDADRWRTWCRIMTGWQDPALRPHVPCPNCGTIAGERAGLRIRIESAGGTGGIRGDAAARAGVCLSCNRTWDAEHFGLLAAQLRGGPAVGAA